MITNTSLHTIHFVFVIFSLVIYANGAINKEKQALLDFKASLEDPFGQLSTWRPEDDDCCKWSGVTCNNQTGHVTKLQMTYASFGVPLTGSLGGLRVNLSRNALLGEIPLKIGEMKTLLSLDLSRNKFSGRIPSSMSQMALLNYLDMSHNNLSGRIPSSTQLQSFEPSRYTGNTELCGPPITKNCPEDEVLEVLPFVGESESGEEGTDELQIWFYIGGGIGFATGFWIACGALLLNHHGRHAFFHFVDRKIRFT